MLSCSSRVMRAMNRTRLLKEANFTLATGTSARDAQCASPVTNSTLTRRGRQGADRSSGLAATKVGPRLLPGKHFLWRQQALKSTSNGTEILEPNTPKAVKTEEDDEEVSDGKKILCEFVLQALFNFLSCSAVAMAVQNSGGNSVLQTLQVMGAHAVILPLVIYSGLEISGAHFNPMVTACFVSVGKVSFRLGIAYVAAQLAGGVVGAAAAFSSLPSSMQTLAHAGIQQVPAASTVQQAFMGEVYASFAFIFVLFGTNVDPRGWGKLKPAAIPLIICLLMWLVGPVSSMCINPARAFGPALVTGFWDHHWIWWTAPFIGGLSAAKIYHSLFLPRSAK